MIRRLGWHNFGPDVSGQVAAILVDGSDVFVGGYYLTIAGQPGNYIGQWNGANWNTVGSGTNGSVVAIEKFNGSIVAGGDFSMAGGISAGNIAAWNGSSWESLGSGVNGTILALKVVGDRLFVGGVFDQAGGAPASNLASWDGFAWSAVESGGLEGVGSTGGGGSVRALGVSGSTLFVGGSFDRAGDTSARNLARFDGASFSSLGAGFANGIDMPGYVTSLATRGARLQIGGDFGIAGGEVSANVAEYVPDQIMSNGAFE